MKTPQGVRYTRDGQFTTSATGLLTDATAIPVLGSKGTQIKVSAAWRRAVCARLTGFCAVFVCLLFECGGECGGVFGVVGGCEGEFDGGVFGGFGLVEGDGDGFGAVGVFGDAG